MKKTSKKVVFFGSGPVAAATLERLSQLFAIEAVITKKRPTHHKDKAPVEELAKNKGLTTFFCSTKKELDTLVDKKHFRSLVGIIVDYGVIVSQKSIDKFELGIINSHFSLLPQWRGADPITFSILSGQKKTGVSLMLIEPTLDTGKLLVQKSLAIKDSDTTPSLTTKLIVLSNSLLEEYIPRYLNGEVKLRAQSHPERASYSRQLIKNDGMIDWNKPAMDIEREIRAYAGWPGSKTKFKDINLTITKAHCVEYNFNDTKPGSVKIIQKEAKLIVRASDGYISVTDLKPDGKKEMSIKAFLAGYGSRIT